MVQWSEQIFLKVFCICISLINLELISWLWQINLKIVCAYAYLWMTEKKYVCVGGCMFAYMYVLCQGIFFSINKIFTNCPLHLLVSCFLVTGNYVYSPRTSLIFFLPIFKDLFSKCICFVLCSTKFNSDHLCDHGLGTIHYTLIDSPMGTHWTLALLFSK